MLLLIMVMLFILAVIFTVILITPCILGGSTQDMIQQAPWQAAPDIRRAASCGLQAAGKGAQAQSSGTGNCCLTA